jgi:hypothetical protein
MDMKIVILVIVMAMILLTSSCATLFSLLDTTAAKTYNDSLASLSEDDREVADKIGLTDVKPSINIAIAVAVDAWALSPIILSSFYADQQEPPPFASIIATTGIFGGIPASLVCSAISLGSTFRTPPSTQIQRYHAQVAQVEREAEAKRIAEEMEAKIKKRFEESRGRILEGSLELSLNNREDRDNPEFIQLQYQADNQEHFPLGCFGLQSENLRLVGL